MSNRATCYARSQSLHCSKFPKVTGAVAALGFPDLLHPETAQALLDNPGDPAPGCGGTAAHCHRESSLCLQLRREWRSMGSPPRCCIQSKYWREPMVRLQRGARDTGMTAQQLALYASSLVP